MASGLLESTGDFLESELDQSCSDLHNNTDQSDDLRYHIHFFVLMISMMSEFIIRMMMTVLLPHSLFCLFYLGCAFFTFFSYAYHAFVPFYILLGFFCIISLSF